jgi:hypothetical protein
LASPHAQTLDSCRWAVKENIRREVAELELDREPDRSDSSRVSIEVGPHRFNGSLSCAVPDGWSVRDSLTILAPDGQANVIASSEPLDESLTTELYADGQGEQLRDEFSNFKELLYGPVKMLGGRDCYMRRFESTPTDHPSDRITQVQVYHAAAGRGYVLTATARSVGFEAIEPILSSLLQSVLIDRENPWQMLARTH